MLYIANENLKLIYKELQNHTGFKTFPQKFEFIDLLKTLNANERHLVAKWFCGIPWNIGSLHVLAALQELAILTATEYILSLNDPLQTQLILNDFLEDEYDLVGNLLINNTLDSTHLIKLPEILQECLKNLFQDLLIQPNLNHLNYMKYFIIKKIPGDIVWHIICKHIDVILDLHQTDIEVALGKFSSWINEGVDNLKFPKDFYEKLLYNYVEDSLNYLLRLSAESNFKGWKFYLILLQTITSKNNHKVGIFLRKYLKTRLKELAFTTPATQAMIHFLITARAANASSLDVSQNLNHYAEWYKANIADMKFILKTEEFQNILLGLEQCIQYEWEEDYLEIHATISIAPPVLCGKLVQAYKRNCKQRLTQIKCKHKQSNIIKSIVIEESL